MTLYQDNLGTRENRVNKAAEQIILQCFINKAPLSWYIKSCDGLEIAATQDGELLSIRTLQRTV
jgi:hypothetical protein